MPKLHGNTHSWEGRGGWVNGALTMQGKVYCARERCNESGSLDETTQYRKLESDRPAWLLPAAERDAALAREEQERLARIAAFEAAPLPHGWWVTESSSGHRRAYCSARCARLDMQKFETGAR